MTDETVEKGFDNALIYMALGDKLKNDQWTQMVVNTKKIGRRDWRAYTNACKLSEQKYVVENIPDYKKFFNGKPHTSEYLSSTYKQYKSRITTALSKGIPLFDENDIPVSASSVQAAIKKCKEREKVSKDMETDLTIYLVVKKERGSQSIFDIYARDNVTGRSTPLSRFHEHEASDVLDNIKKYL